MQLSVIFRCAAYDSADISGCGSLSENVGRPCSEEPVPIAATFHQLVASVLLVDLSQCLTPKPSMVWP